MKVLRILTRLNVGGPARQVLALQREMSRLGVDEVVVAGSVDSGEQDLSSMLGRGDVIRLVDLQRPLNPLRDLKALRRLQELIREHRPDVVHTHLSKAGLLGRVAALRNDVPVTVHTFHGHVFQGYFSNTIGKLIARTERHLAARTTVLLAVGEGVRNDLVAHHVAPPERIDTLEAGIDLSPFLDIGEPGGRLRETLEMSTNAKVVGFAGRFVPVKRLDRFVEVMGQIAEIDSTTHFVFCGDGPERRILEQAALTGPLRGRVHLLGWTGDMTDFYAAIDVMFLSSANEGTPVSLIEAGASGRPCVATNVGGVSDVVRDGRTGYLVKRDCANAAKALLSLLNSPSTAREMGANARIHVGPRFGAERLARDLLTIYEGSLRSAARSRESGSFTAE